MNNFNYSTDRYFQLLKWRATKDKILTSIERVELNKYSCCLDNALCWATKNRYLDLLEELICGKIDSFKFYIKFGKINDLSSELFDTLKSNYILLSPHLREKKFSNFICEISQICYSYSEIFELSLPKEEMNSYNLEFRNSIEKIYLKINNFLNE